MEHLAFSSGNDLGLEEKQKKLKYMAFPESHRLTYQLCLHKVVLHGQWVKCIQQLFFLNLIFSCILSFTTEYSDIIHDTVS